jgi:RNA polymerase primary sigma factor
MRQLKITNRITSRESLSLDKYLQEISKIPLLRPEEEAVLAQKIRMGDNAALEKLTSANLRFVVSVAKQYVNQGLTLADLINEGNIGLMKAARRFDETRGFKFISYGVWWIRQSILQAIVEYSRIVRLPLNKVAAYNRVNEAYLAFIQEMEREPTSGELSELLGLTQREVEDLLHGNNRHVSMDAPIGGEDSEVTMLDNMVETGDETPDAPLLRESLREELAEGMKFLELRERQVLEAFYGLNGSTAMSLDEIAEYYNLTRERVRQVKERAIRRMRRSYHGSALKMFLG